MKSTKIIITCEHYTNHIPQEYQHLFAGNGDILELHNAYDIGSDKIAEGICDIAKLPLHKGNISRLLIDFNRNLHNPQVYSKFSENLPNEEKVNLINNYYKPYRDAVEADIKKLIDSNYQVLHLSMHTFTPNFNNIFRNVDIGILYDPRSHAEKEVSRVIKRFIINENSKYIVRLNYPYKGRSDGFTTTLRKKYPAIDYLGIEIECNQRLVANDESLNLLIKNLGNSINELKLYLY